MKGRRAPSVRCSVTVSLLFAAVLLMLVAEGEGRKGDHGGIPMGVQNIFCDDAKVRAVNKCCILLS